MVVHIEIYQAFILQTQYILRYKDHERHHNLCLNSGDQADYNQVDVIFHTHGPAIPHK